MNKPWDITSISRRGFLSWLTWFAVSTSVPVTVQDVIATSKKSLVDISMNMTSVDLDKIEKLFQGMKKYPWYLSSYLREAHEFSVTMFWSADRLNLGEVSKESVRDWIIENYKQQAEGLKVLFTQYFDTLPGDIQNRIPDMKIEPSFLDADEYFRFIDLHNKPWSVSQMCSLHFQLPEKQFDWGYIDFMCDWIPESSESKWGFHYYVDMIYELGWIWWIIYWLRTQDAEKAFEMYDMSESDVLKKIHNDGDFLGDSIWSKQQKLQRIQQEPIQKKLGIPGDSMSLKYFLETHSWLVPVQSYELLYSGRLLQIIQPKELTN